MDLIGFYNLLLDNRGVIKVLYGLLIVAICLIIVSKTHKLFHLSLHQGIRYLRNAFLFFGIAFFIRYLIAAYGFFYPTSANFYLLTKSLFEFFIIMGGFFLLYSLLWKKFESEKNPKYSSLFNFNILAFYLMALLIVIGDYLFDTYSLMFFSQILLFIFISIISSINYRRGEGRHKFLKFYFIAMMLSLAAWILNAVSALLLNWDIGIMINIYIINMIIFLLFLYGVIKAIKK
ncbi:MAG: hypothetical protein KKA64_03045 [Nanoarchaeota archaeon]|nr:hypothetical protein [Nanoarchaeota archaeon]